MEVLKKILEGFDKWLPPIASTIVAIFATPVGIYNIIWLQRYGVGLIALAVGVACIAIAINDIKNG